MADKASIPELLGFLGRETRGSRMRIIVPTVAAGLSRGALLWVFTKAATEAGHRQGLNLMLVGAFAAALLVYLVAAYISAISSDQLVRTLLNRLRLRICGKLIHAPLRLVEAQDPGKVFTLIGHESERLASVAKDFIITFQAGIVLAGALAYLAWNSPASFAIATLTILAGATTYYWHEHKAKLRYRQAREKEVEYFDTMYDLLHGFRDLKLDRAQQDEIMAHLNTVSEEFRGLGAASARLYQVSELVSQAFTFGLIAVIVFLLPILVPGDAASTFTLLTIVLYLLAPVEQMISSMPVFSQGAVALANISRLEEAVGTEILREKGTQEQTPFLFERIDLSQVRFEFRSASADESFDLGPLDLSLRRGEILLIYGGNGAGKTTLLKLIAGLYHPASGAVLLDGRPVEGLRSAGYRELFAVVFSDPYLMQRLYGLGELDPEMVKALLTELELDRKTTLRDRRFSSTRLSAGQRKRLAYAISRLRDRQIYIFDEFAADQDPQFRTYFYTVLLPRLKQQGKTVVAVTHDERWFGAGDRLVKLEYGKIVDMEALAPQAQVQSA
jgi:putative pyoverdin transport system ATP-binding/permease protein